MVYLISICQSNKSFYNVSIMFTQCLLCLRFGDLQLVHYDFDVFLSDGHFFQVLLPGNLFRVIFGPFLADQIDRLKQRDRLGIGLE